MKSYIILAGFMLSFAFAAAQTYPQPMAASSDPRVESAPGISRLLSAKPRLHGIRDRRERMTLRLTGIYTWKEVLYYRLQVTNHSMVAYDPGLLRFSIRDRKMVRRHAFQEIDQQGLLASGNMDPVGAGERRVWIVALSKEVPSGAQYQVINLLERHGGRHFRLKVGFRKILRARIVNDLQLRGN
jgi:hypothetical protein